MAETAQFVLQPHQDIELERPRHDLELFATLPSSGVNEKTGLLLILDDFSGFANSVYQAQEVRPYLADRYNLVVAGLNYFGIDRKRSIEIRNGFLQNLRRIYGISLDTGNMTDQNQFFGEVAAQLARKGVVMLDQRCQPVVMDGRGEYQSWGFLPAIDGLQSVGFLLGKYPQLDRQRVSVYGQGYGGYIAGLMAKFAPRTFATVIDKDGFVKTELKHVATGELLDPGEFMEIPFSDFPIPFRYSVMFESPWTIEDEENAGYFSDSHRKIRSLLLPEHHQASDTRYYLFQGTDDRFGVAAARDRYATLLQKFHPVQYKKLPPVELGTNHQELFDQVAAAETENFCKAEADNDFSLNRTYTLSCGEKSYVFAFRDDYSLQVSVKQSRRNKVKCE
ncbi:MAG TPA: DUF2920 family protein [Patescibacteria group bacterium]|nr:DUF2920 family protein [Patescibacteria group bacterium]